jgi:hypothetical protein
MRWWWQWGIVFANGRWENNLRVKNMKLSRRSSLSGTLSEMGMNIGGVRQCGGVDEVVVVVGRGVRKREAGEGAEGQKCERFRVRCRKRGRGAVRGGAAMVQMR